MKIETTNDVLLSIRPQWVELIAAGVKTAELRKSEPYIQTPFTAYIYQTKQTWKWTFDLLRSMGMTGLAERLEGACGRVIGEFTCDHITRHEYYHSDSDPVFDPEPRESYIPGVDLDAVCLKEYQILDYGARKPLYSWHISDLKIYDRPKRLNEFQSASGQPITRAPQSWCYAQANRKE